MSGHEGQLVNPAPAATAPERKPLKTRPVFGRSDISSSPSNQYERDAHGNLIPVKRPAEADTTEEAPKSA